MLEIPDWVINNKTKLAELYSSFSLKENEEPYLDSVILIKKSDGSLYDKGSISYEVFKPKFE